MPPQDGLKASQEAFGHLLVVSKSQVVEEGQLAVAFAALVIGQFMVMTRWGHEPETNTASVQFGGEFVLHQRGIS